LRIKAVIGYDGTGYGGFQIQDNAPTIQAEIEGVLARLTGVSTRILAAGRTDAGVHAEGQVIAFDTGWRHSVEDLQRGMNALLPAQIAVFELQEAAPEFHPRFDALTRRYRYTIYRSAVRHPLYARTSLHLDRPLDVKAMNCAAKRLVGVHDFLAFGSPPQGECSQREVIQAAWSQQDPWLWFDIEANAFLYRMVRMLVGTMLRVGEGTLTVEAFAGILETRDRGRAGPAVAAKGLCLRSVTYDDGPERA
jgi:tRNA pseudouridine38-40 synthase